MDQTTVHAQIEQAAPVAPVTQASKPQAAKLAYCMLQGFRPMSGQSLFAHTAAFFKLSGMSETKAVPNALVSRVMGSTAVRYHLKQTGFFDQTERGLVHSATGREYFTKIRATNPELVAACVEILTTGKPNDKICKNPVGIKAL